MLTKIYYAIFLAGIATLTTAQTCSPSQVTYVGQGCVSNCPPGSQRQGKFCYACPPGTYTPGQDYGSCLTCNYGFIAPSSGSYYCYPCPSGSVAFGGTSCQGCNSNAVSNPIGGMNYCSTCLAGTKPSGDRSYCENCQAGTFSPGGQVTCDSCPAGTYSLPRAEACSNCDPDSISNPGSSGCSQCPGGSIPAPNKRSCSSCPRNTFSSGAVCAPCPEGSTSNPGSASCGPRPSPVNGRRATPQQILDSLKCPTHLIPCADVWGKARCVVPSQDLFSCGGCGKGYNGDQGRDCSASDSFASAQCLEGRCVLSCPEGYMLKGERCISDL